MRCPYCDHLETQVSDTRTLQEAHTVRRRRICLSCQRRFTTYERAELQLPRVIKKDGTRMPYERTKLQASLDLALRKRPVSTEAVANCIARIEEKLTRLGVREITSQRIGDEVVRELKKLDKVAYVRFASVYRNFEDVKEFSDTVKEILPRKK